MTPSAMKRVGELAQIKPVDHAAYRAATEAGGDPIKAALAVGRAMGRNDERGRRRMKVEPILDVIGDKDPAFERPSQMNRAYADKSCRRVRYAVQRVYGDTDILNTANALIEREAYKLGFAAAMRLLGECGVAVVDGQGEGNKPLEA